ncbi:hypothetical protein ACOSQ2_003021 [Xanthoceras sorbifolium]
MGDSLQKRESLLARNSSSILSFVSLPPLLTLSLVELHATSRQTLQLFTPSVTKRCWFAVQFSTNPSYPEHLQLEWEMLSR